MENSGGALEIPWNFRKITQASGATLGTPRGTAVGLELDQSSLASEGTVLVSFHWTACDDGIRALAAQRGSQRGASAQMSDGDRSRSPRGPLLPVPPKPMAKTHGQSSRPNPTAKAYCLKTRP